jgi:hypothetical protein
MYNVRLSTIFFSPGRLKTCWLRSIYWSALVSISHVQSFYKQGASNLVAPDEDGGTDRYIVILP